MTTTAPLRLVLAASAAAGLVFTPVLAQSSVECRAMGTDEERIACLEARIDALEQQLEEQGALPAPAATAEPAAPPASPPEASFGAEQLDRSAAALEAAAAPVAPAAAEPVAREGRRWLRMPGVPFFGRDDDESGEEAPPETAVAAAAPVPAPPEPAAADSFGAEQIAPVEASRATRREVVQATIVDFEELHRGRIVVALDNGQMWRQMDVDSRQVRVEPGQSVEIRRSGFGGYRMKIADNDRIVTVERLR